MIESWAMKFDAYEYIGVIVPGTIVLYTAAVLHPALLPGLSTSLSLADFGITLILAFIAGHLVQAGGNAWEKVVWSLLGGMPTTWVAKERTTLLSTEQLDRLDARLARDFECDRTALKKGHGPMRELFIHVRKLGKSDRVDKFNRNYGLLRGVAVAFIAAALLMILKSTGLWREALTMLLFSTVATYRMVRFGIHYAREVFAEYLALATTKDDQKPVQSSTT